ncbi:MAG: hypothetical protein ACO3RU_12220 [Planctomycetota bacterium]
MRSLALILTSSALFAGPVLGQMAWPLPDAHGAIPHSQAAVNDPRSHGVIGDQLLSLAEAILLTNGEIDENALSAEEVAQLSGFGGDIAWAEINASVVPVVTLERPLPTIRDTPHGFTITGAGGTPTIDLRDSRGLVVESDFFDSTNVRYLGGAYGIQLSQRDTLFGTLLDRVVFEGQEIAGLQVINTSPGHGTRVQVVHCRFVDVPTGIAFYDVGSARTGRLEVFGDTRFTGCGTGIDVLTGSAGSLTLLFSGLSMAGGATGIRIATPGPSARPVTITGRYLDLTASARAFWLDADASARALMLVQSSAFQSPGSAFRAGPLGANVDLTFQDSRTDGDVFLATGSTGRIQAMNAFSAGGSWTLGSDNPTGVVQVSDSLLRDSAVGTAGNATIRLADSCLEGGSVAGRATALVAIDDSHRAATTTVGAHVTENRPLAAAQLGSFDATPTRPLLGTLLQLRADLPAGIDGFVLFGRPNDSGAPPFSQPRIYCDLGSAVVLPTPLSGQAQLPVPIPAAPQLVGVELFFHLLAAPQPGTTAPPLTLPPGRRIRIG